MAKIITMGEIMLRLSTPNNEYGCDVGTGVTWGRAIFVTFAIDTLTKIFSYIQV